MGLCPYHQAHIDSSFHSSCQREEDDFPGPANLCTVCDQDGPHPAQGVLWLHLLHHVGHPQLLCTGQDHGSVHIPGSWAGQEGLPWSADMAMCLCGAGDPHMYHEGPPAEGLPSHPNCNTGEVKLQHHESESRPWNSSQGSW